MLGDKARQRQVIAHAAIARHHLQGEHLHWGGHHLEEIFQGIGIFKADVSKASKP